VGTFSFVQKKQRIALISECRPHSAEHAEQNTLDLALGLQSTSMLQYFIEQYYAVQILLFVNW